MKVQVVLKVVSEIEVVELQNDRQLKAAILESAALDYSVVKQVMDAHGIANGSLIVAVKLNGTHEAMQWIGVNGKVASYAGYCDRKSQVRRVLSSEWSKRYAKRFALVG